MATGNAVHESWLSRTGRSSDEAATGRQTVWLQVSGAFAIASGQRTGALLTSPTVAVVGRSAAESAEVRSDIKSSNRREEHYENRFASHGILSAVWQSMPSETAAQ